jgi:hypothetical protein
MPSDSLSILDIQDGLIECLAAREEAATPEEVAAADAAISAYCAQEVQKVDGIARAVRQWTAMAAADKAEASRLRERSAALEARIARLKEFVRFAMERRGKRRIEGKLSTIRIQGAGGKQGVDIHDESLIPDEFCDVTITATVRDWGTLDWAKLKQFRIGPRVPRLSDIAEALARPCPDCAGSKDDPEDEVHARFKDSCPSCGGSGHAGVPGASLRPRAEIVVIA